MCKVEVIKLDVLAVYMCTIFSATLTSGDQHWQLLITDKNGDISDLTLVIFCPPVPPQTGMAFVAMHLAD